MVLDGAMGTMIQQHQLTEADFRGELLAQHPIALRGNNDVLSLTQPQLIADIHRRYLGAGADIIETNTFCSTSIAQREYGAEALVVQLNRVAVQLARQLADEFTRQNPAKPRFVAGSMGPTGVMLSKLPDVPHTALSFDQLVDAYAQQATALIEGGVDLLLVETVIDGLNAKAALFAIAQVQRQRHIDVPVMLSATVDDTSGHLLAGQSLEALIASVEHYPLLSIGLNCSFGIEQMMPHLDTIARSTETYVSVHPSAGLPNMQGLYDQTPELMATAVGRMLTAGMVNIVGGCCGTTPEHIARIAQVAELCSPRRRPKLNHHMLPIEQARANAPRIDWSAFRPTPPQCAQLLSFESYPLCAIIPHIDWAKFLCVCDNHVCRSVLLQHQQGLTDEAQELLQLIDDQGLLRASAAVGIFPAASLADDIVLYTDATRSTVRTRIPMLRSQQAGLEANPCLADFVAPERLGLADWVGCFALTAGQGADELSQRYRDQHDELRAIMVKILADCLAEAFAEHLHRLVCTQLWGYSPADAPNPCGIRPVPGHPVCPDHRSKRAIFDLLGVEQRLGMGLSRSMAITPSASVAGFYIAHPQAHYFSVGRIEADQLADYAQRLGISIGEAVCLMNVS